MDHIKEALTKANATLDSVSRNGEGNALAGAAMASHEPGDPNAAETGWTPPLMRLDPRLMERNRVVAFDLNDPNHVPFNLLRTRVRKIMQDRNWTSLGITSPTPGCGKTMVALNLAMSLARASESRVVLVDLDLKKPAVASTLGLQPPASIGSFLRQEARAEDCFVRVTDNLTVGLNRERLRESSELIQSSQMASLRRFINTSMAPDILLFDLPPMGASDDALAFLPQVDGILLIVAAGATSIGDADIYERQISEMDKLAGIVMNKSRDEKQDHYYYY